MAAAPLQPMSTATSAQVRDLATDGPFAGTREQLGGYFPIEASDLDQEIARPHSHRPPRYYRNPAGGRIDGVSGAVRGRAAGGPRKIKGDETYGKQNRSTRSRWHAQGRVHLDIGWKT